MSKKELTPEQKLAKKEADRKYQKAKRDRIKQEKIDSGVIIKQYNLPDGLDLEKSSNNYITIIDTSDDRAPYVEWDMINNTITIDTYLITELKNKQNYKQIKHKNYFYDFKTRLLLFENIRPETGREIWEDLTNNKEKLLIVLKSYLNDKVFFPNQNQINEVIEEEEDYDNNEED